jgi:hypothetical protein
MHERNGVQFLFDAFEDPSAGGLVTAAAKARARAKAYESPTAAAAAAGGGAVGGGGEERGGAPAGKRRGRRKKDRKGAGSVEDLEAMFGGKKRK